MNTFIWVKENALTLDFCNRCINKFELDPGKERYKGITLGKSKDIKRSLDLQASLSPHWKNEDKIFFSSLKKAWPEYMEQIGKRLNLKNMDHRGGHDVEIKPFVSANYDDAGYQLQKTTPGGYYDWHHDYHLEEKKSRAITYIWYLNDIERDGETQFYDGTKIKPTAGRLVLFPATWTFYHKGIPPKDEIKYICTGWMRTNL